MGDDRGILPYTVIVNRQGKIASSIFGRINKRCSGADGRSAFMTHL